MAILKGKFLQHTCFDIAFADFFQICMWKNAPKAQFLQKTLTNPVLHCIIKLHAESDFRLSRFNIDLKDVYRRVFIYVANFGWGCSSALLLHDKKRMKMQSYQNGW